MAAGMEYYRDLLDRYIKNAVSDRDAWELFDFIKDQPEAASQLLEEAGGEEYFNSLKQVSLDPQRSIRMHQRLLEAMRTQAPVRSITGRHTRKWMWAAAAAVFILAGAGIWFFKLQTPNFKPQTAVVTHDVAAPVINKATITLSDGRRIILDSAGNGTLLTEGSTKLEKLSDGEIAYQPLTTDHSPLTYNTLTNPRGSKVISLTLSDGSRVWLNAESSLKYPTAFNGNDRRVEITGEAYFEVAHDASKPFIVSKGQTEVQVLGTHFNVNAYDDEDAVRITLLEGSVRVKSEIPNSKSEIVIKPGQQAIVKSNSPFTIDHSPNIDEVMAWKNSKFYFDGANIQQVMRQLSKWYDVNVQYKDVITGHFTGVISRNVNVSEVFKMLEQTGGAGFSIEGKNVVVMK